MKILLLILIAFLGNCSKDVQPLVDAPDAKHDFSSSDVFFDQGSEDSGQDVETSIPDISIDMEETQNPILLVPPDHKIYHAAFPDFGGEEDLVSKERITKFVKLGKKEVAWAYFSNNWSKKKGGIRFPSEEVSVIHASGHVPFIRMMARSRFAESGPDPVYTMDRFLAGDFEKELVNWAKDARKMNIPLLVEFGTEVNGKWFPWNAKWNGAGTKDQYGDPNLYDGMEKFRDVFRLIIDTCKKEGANNITWFYHADISSDPNKKWNTLSGYYPGDDYIDWIGLSVYGPQTPDEGWWTFEDIMNDSWAKVLEISKTKPIAILEWGVVDAKSVGDKAKWIKEAMKSISPGGPFYPKIKAVSYWHEDFDQSNLRIDSSKSALEAYQEAISSDLFISDPKFGPR